MPVEFQTQEKLTLWAQPDGPGTAMKPMSLVGNELNRHGLSGVTLQRPGREIVYGTDALGRFRAMVSPVTAPGGAHTATINFLAYNGIDRIQQLSETQERFTFQRRYGDGQLRHDNPDAWTVLEHFMDASITGETAGDGPVIPAASGTVPSTGTAGFTDRAILLRPALTALTAAETEDFLCIAALGNIEANGKRIPGYPGPDQIIFFGAAATGAAVANVSYSVNGGSVISLLDTDPSPFAEVDTNVVAAAARPISKTQYRLIVFGGANATTKAQFAYADFNFGATTLTPTWTVVTIAATTITDGVTAVVWAQDDELYIATTGGDIYLSQDRGATDPGAAIYTGTQDLNQIIVAPDNQIWAVGASNTLLRGNCGGFSALTGPAAGVASYSIAVADDGTVFVGNGIVLYRSRNVDTGTWDTKKSYGTNKNPRHIHLVKNNSELLLVVVDNAAPGQAEVWRSEDGGYSNTMISILDNDGYNAAYFSRNGLDDGNLAWIVGDDDPLGVVHKLSVASAVC